jgi:small multidrug resistance pump
MNPFVLLMLAIVSEIVATTALKLSEGFSKPLPSLVVIVGYVLAFYLMSLVMKSVPLGTAYAIWAGVGTAGAVMIGVLVWREPLDSIRMLAIGLIVTGVVLLNFFSNAHAA